MCTEGVKEACVDVPSQVSDDVPMDECNNVPVVLQSEGNEEMKVIKYCDGEKGENQTLVQMLEDYSLQDYYEEAEFFFKY